MKYKIKNLNFVSQDNIVAKLMHDCQDLTTAELTKLLNGMANKQNITTDMEFSEYSYFALNDVSDKYCYLILVDDTNTNMYVVRQDNVVEVPELEDKYRQLDIKHIIKSGNKTILLPNARYTKKVVVERSLEDADDTVKAIMICLLKREGYNIDDIYTIADDVDAKYANKAVEVPAKINKKNKHNIDVDAE